MTIAEPEKFVYSLQIKEHHLDTLGHVNNAVYLQLFEEARWDFISRYGYGLTEIHTSGLGPVILDLRVKFKKEIKNREWVQIESVSSLVKKDLFFEINQEMVNEKKQLACQAWFFVGIMDLKTRKLVKPPEKWLKAIGLGPKADP